MTGSLPQPMTLLAPAVAALVGVGIGVWLGRLGRSKIIGEKLSRDAELARLESQAREQSRQVTKLRNEQGAMSRFARVLPDFARDINHANLDERAIQKRVFALIESIFEPEQTLLYLLPPGSSEEESRQVLHLVNGTGTANMPASATKIKVGDGKIGWVASTKVEMSSEDWLNMTRTDGKAIDNNHPSLRLDLIGPLIHNDGTKARLLGVLCVGNPASRPRDEKAMLAMVTNLASIAFMNSRITNKLRELANTDGLTTLLNKRYFMKDGLGSLIDAAEQKAAGLSVFIFDIDHFKKYNDRNGHLAGDDILKKVSQVIKDNLRPNDVACRYGGEEFIVAMPGTRPAEGLAGAERIRAAIEATPFPNGETQPGGKVTISGGVANFPIDGRQGKELIEHADQALYKAKGAGRNRVMEYRGVDIGGDGSEEPMWVPHGDTLGDR